MTQTRRNFFLLAGATIAAAQDGTMIPHLTRPEDLEMPLSGFADYITPFDHFFVRTHVYVPTVKLSQFEKTGHVHLADSGNVYITDEGTGAKVIIGKYLATYTPLDLNSFDAHLTVAYTPAGSTAQCTETTEVAYIRSSAD